MKKLTTEQKAMYEEFVRKFPRCWGCEFQKLPTLGSIGFSWNKLENAHIVGGHGRRADRRAIVRLCMVHHKLFDGERIAHYDQAGKRKQLKPMDIHEIMWLKKHFDPKHYDVEFIMSLRTKRYESIVPVKPKPFLL